MIKLGFSFAYGVFGYGLVIPHHGTIVVGRGNRIGNYCVLQTSSCITEGNRTIGNGFYVATGAKIIHDFNCGDNVSVSANSVVNKDIGYIDNCLIAGMPAKYIKPSSAWYDRDGSKYSKKVELCDRIYRSYIGDI